MTTHNEVIAKQAVNADLSLAKVENSKKTLIKFLIGYFLVYFSSLTFDMLYTHTHLKSNITYGWLGLDVVVFIVYAFFGLFGVYKQRMDILLWYFGMSVVYSIVSLFKIIDSIVVLTNLDYYQQFCTTNHIHYNCEFYSTDTYTNYFFIASILWLLVCIMSSFNAMCSTSSYKAIQNLSPQHNVELQISSENSEDSPEYTIV